MTKAIIVLYIGVVLLGLTGWVKDIVKLVHCDFQAPYKCEVIYGVGVTPAGAIIGWLNIED